MEPLDGIELCRRALASGFPGAMLLHSACLTPEVRERAALTGVHAIVPKGVAADELAARLSSLCDLRGSSAGATAAPHPAGHLVELLDLSRHEALLLSVLLHTPAPLPARALIERVWGRRGSRNLFDVTRQRLDRKLEGTGWTVRAAGSGRGDELARAAGTAE